MIHDIAQLTSRRTFLKASGITLALPWLESLGGALHAADAATEPRRLLLVCLPLGIYRDSIIPAEAGPNFTAPAYLTHLEPFRSKYSILSGLDHPGVSGGHGAQPRIFTGVPSAESNRISLDQHVAATLGQYTRFDCLPLSAGAGDFSWTASGSMVPAYDKMADVYSMMFLATDPRKRKEIQTRLDNGQSILDFLDGQAASLKPRLSSTDQAKLEEYFDTVRNTEKRLAKSESWLDRPKPEVKAKPPVDPTSKDAISESIRNAFDMAFLGLKTDSTRVITVGYFRQGNVDIPGVENAYHALSHHGKDPGSIAQLNRIEDFFFQEFASLLDRLEKTREGDATLLDRTTIIVTSNLGNGSNHSNKDLPVLLAGGRFEHGSHHAFEPSTVPLSNLYVSVLNQLGLPDTSFGTSTGPLQGLNLA